MIDEIKEFFEMNVPRREIRQFTKEEIDSLAGKLPVDAIELLEHGGKSALNDDFFWTVLPDDYYSMLEGWGIEKQRLDPSKCHVFLRTSFGTLIYFHINRYYYLNPFSGVNTLCGRELDTIMVLSFLDERFLNIFFWLDLHKRIRNELPRLQEDEIYAIVPSISEGGSPDTSKVEVVKMKEHLAQLSKLYKHRVTEE